MSTQGSHGLLLDFVVIVWWIYFYTCNMCKFWYDSQPYLVGTYECYNSHHDMTFGSSSKNILVHLVFNPPFICP